MHVNDKLFINLGLSSFSYMGIFKKKVYGAVSKAP